MADSDLEIIKGGGGGGCSTYNGLYVEVPWFPLEKNIFLFRLQVRMGRDFSSRSILKKKSKRIYNTCIL